jgi:hypothetical protein
MGGKSLNRRAFLFSTASIGGLLALVSRLGTANAFEIQTLRPNSPLALQIKNHCSTSAYHQEILIGLERDLMKKTGTPGKLLTLTAYCPICGCPIVATRYVS